MRGIAAAIAVGLCALTAVSQTTKSSATKSAEPKLTLGKPIQIGTLALVPIEAKAPLSRDEYTVLADATRFGWVHITEVPEGQEVNTLSVKNTGKLPLMLFAGELLLGGQQDRIVGRDTIVPPGETVKVPVFCVEHGRWSGNSLEFRGGDTFVPDDVRQAAVAGNQDEVWNGVARTNGRTASRPATGTIRGTLDNPQVRSAANALVAKLQKGLPQTSRTVGFVCWLNGKVHSADVFANHKMFAGSRDKLLRSYAVDAQLAKNPVATKVSLKACEAFLAEIISARRELGDRGLYGSMYRLKNGKVQGYESGSVGFGGGGLGGGPAAGGAGFGHGSYKPGKGGG